MLNTIVSIIFALTLFSGIAAWLVYENAISIACLSVSAVAFIVSEMLQSRKRSMAREDYTDYNEKKSNLPARS